jgi:putative phosphoesterase
MKLLILSDIHDNIWKLDEALERGKGAEVLLCLGDLCSPFVVPRLAKGFEGPIHIVYGNNDGDRYRITNNARKEKSVTLHGEFADLDLGGLRVALVHFDDIGRAIAGNPAYDLVCYGHNHEYETAREGKTRRINPGAIMGAPNPPSFVLYHSKKDEVEKIELG